MFPIFATFILLFAMGTGQAALPPDAAASGEHAKLTPLTVPSSGKTGFALLHGSTTGIHFTNQLSSERSLTNQIFLNGSGVALGDVDGDGWCDIYLCGLDGANVLYRNLGGWQFEDVTARSGVACADQASTGATFADVDGDGDLDLVVAGIGRGARLFLNNGHGNFQETTKLSGLAGTAGSMSLAMADIDGDGLLDLYLVNYRSSTFRDEPEKRFSAARKKGAVQIVAVDGRPVTEPDLAGRFTADASLALVENGEADVLYRNLGGGRLEPVSWTNGNFLKADGKPSDIPYDWGLSAMFRDLNGDGAPDLYVCNDFQSEDRLWMNDGHGRFQAATNLALRQTSLFSMGVDFADIDRDSFDDFFVADMLSRDHARRQVQVSDRKLPDLPFGVLDNRPQYSRNTLFHNRGDGTFAEIAQLSGLAASEWSWCPVFLDVDLDGFEDLLITTGHARDAQNIDISRKIETMSREKPLSWREKIDLRRLFPELRTPNLAFRNRHDLTFEESGKEWGFSSDAICQGMALADLDNDGDLDVVVNSLNGPALIYRNETSAPRISVRLRGLAPNTRGIGARVLVTCPGLPLQQQEMICGGRYLSSDDTIRTFAAGASGNELVVEVIWRNGSRTVVNHVRPNTLCEILEAGASPSTKRQESVVPLFEDVSARISFQHVETPFDDFARQPLLPFKLSQPGPGVAWFDFDGDGFDDLFIGSGRDGGVAYFRGNAEGGFTRDTRLTASANTINDQTGLLVWKNGSGDPTLLLSSSSERGSKPGVNALDLAHPEASSRSLVSGAPFNSGPLALADFDGDGALDLFVGGRSAPGHFPEPGSSWIFRNREGLLELDAPVSRAFEHVGFVNSALWTDLDNDGHPELVLALLHGPIRIWKFQNGAFLEISRELGFEKTSGLWNSIQSGDFNGDGLQDLVAGNWGRNSRYQSHLTDGLCTYYADLDGDGTVEVIEAYRDPGFSKVVPWKDWESLARSLPFVRDRFDSFTAFSTASVQEILGDRFAALTELKLQTLDSTLFLNRGGHFETIPLPIEAQVAPVFGLATGDVNGDGWEDLILAQNFFEVPAETSRLDAGRSLLLLGDGRGGFSAMSGQASGVRVYGEGRGTAVSDFDHDGRLDIAITQNGNDLKLYKNQGAKPGLRVIVRGPRQNPGAIGAVVRINYTDGTHGPAKEIHVGGGYLSQDSSTLIFGLEKQPKSLQVRWTGKVFSEHEIPLGSREVRVQQP